MSEQARLASGLLGHLMSNVDASKRQFRRKLADLLMHPMDAINLAAERAAQDIPDQLANGAIGVGGVGSISSRVQNDLLRKLYTEEALLKMPKRGTVVYMTPDDFLQLAMPIDRVHPDVVAKVNELAGVGRFNDVPYLELGVNNKGNAVVSTHEGRHRALALKQQGVDSMGVGLNPRSSLAKEYPDMTHTQWSQWLQDLGQIYPESGSSNVVKYSK